MEWGLFVYVSVCFSCLVRDEYVGCRDDEIVIDGEEDEMRMRDCG